MIGWGLWGPNGWDHGEYLIPVPLAQVTLFQQTKTQKNIHERKEIYDRVPVETCPGLQKELQVQKKNLNVFKFHPEF